MGCARVDGVIDKDVQRIVHMYIQKINDGVINDGVFSDDQNDSKSTYIKRI